jgi:hypothetical protein
MKNILPQNLLLLFVLVLFTESCSKETSNRPLIVQLQSNPKANNATLPKPDHVVIVIEENHAYQQIVGSDSAPYINYLINEPYTVTFPNSYAITHPSQPNYLCLYSGWNQNVTTDSIPANIPFTTANLGRQLIDAGKSFATYSQNLPYIGYNGDSYGYYARRHNSAANWMGTGTNQIPSTTNLPFTSFPSDFTQLPTVSLVIPNLNCDMHDGSIKNGDTWLANNLNKYVQWARTHNGLFILTFDEDNTRHNNNILTLFYGPIVRSGRDSIIINHYNVLRTIESIYGLPYAGNAANVKTISNCWK